jgi:predicted histone-like DNA-binding protein
MIYKIVERINPTKRDEAPKYYGYIVSMNKLSIEEIATRISASCTVTRHDCLAVLSALQEQIIYSLQEGKSVALGDLGTFRIVAKGLGSETAKEYNTSYMKKLLVRFTPNTKLKNALELKNSAISLKHVEFAEEENSENGETE